MTGAPGDVDPRFARSVARWLVAYPRRWRVARAAEVTDLLADLAEPGARRLDLRSGLGLVRAGWATRWREHPPLRPWLGYVLLERRMDARYRDWVNDDVESPWFSLRRALGIGVIFLGFAASQAWGGGDAPVELLTMVLPMVLVATAAFGPFHRDRLVEKHLTIRPGEVVTPAGRVHALVARTRFTARSWTTTACVVAISTLVASATVLTLAGSTTAAVGCGRACLTVESLAVTWSYREGVLLAAAAALGAGLVVAVLGGRRLRRWTSTPQPARWVTPLGTYPGVRLAAAAASVTALAVAMPGLPAMLATPLLVAAAFALPSLLVARHVVATGGTRATAGVEVLRALTGRGDPADRPVPGFLPATTWLPAGTIAPPPVAPPYPSGALPTASSPPGAPDDPHRPRGV